MIFSRSIDEYVFFDFFLGVLQHQAFTVKTVVILSTVVRGVGMCDQRGKRAPI